MSRPRLAIPLLLALLTAALACVALAGAAPDGPAVPAGPRLTFLEAEFPIKANKVDKEEVRLVSTDPEGGDTRPLLHSSTIRGVGWGVSWSADGSEFAFSGEVIGSHSHKYRIYLAAADGTGIHAIAGTTGADTPVLSPDGSLLAFSRNKTVEPKWSFKHPKSIIESLEHSYSSTTTWVVRTAGGRPRRLTDWGNGRFSAPNSISPDGSTLAVDSQEFGEAPQIEAIDMATGKARTMEADGSEAAYSPDGSEIAFASYRDHESVKGFDGLEAVTELYVARADGSGAHRITHTPKLQEGSPSWDPSGSRLAYQRAPGGFLELLNLQEVESNADGTCPLAIPVPKPRHKGWETLVGAPTWWAGPERGAGPISC